MDLTRARGCFKRFMDGMCNHSMAVHKENGQKSNDDYFNELQIPDMKYLCKMMYTEYMSSHQDSLYKDDPVTPLYIETISELEYGYKLTDYKHDAGILMRKVKEFEEYSKQLEQYYEQSIGENEKRITDLKAELANAVDVCNAQANEMNFLRKEIECLEQELKGKCNNSDEAMNDVINEMADLRDRLDAKNNAIKLLTDEIKSAKDDYATLDSENDDLWKQIGSLEDKLDKKDDIIDNLKHMLDERDDRDDIIDDLKKQISLLNHDIATKDTIIDDQKHDIQSLKDDLKYLESENGIKDREIDEHIRKIRSLEDDIKYLEDESCRFEERVHSLGHDVKSKDAVISDMRHKNQQQEMDLLTLRDVVASFENIDVKAMTGQIRSLESQLAAANSTITMLSNDLNEKMGNICDMNDLIHKLNGKLKLVDDSSLRKDSRVIELTYLTERLQNDIDNLNQQIVIMSDHINGIETRCRHLSSALQVATDENSKLSDSLKAKTDENSKLSDEFAAINIELLKLVAKSKDNTVDSHDIIENFL